MKWDKPMLTDSGGFQVFSLGKQLLPSGGEPQVSDSSPEKRGARGMAPAKISDEGVEFTSHRDGTKHFFSPEKAIEIQRQIGADIIMAFDECTPDQADEKYTNEALDRTHRWAKQCKEYWEKHDRKSSYGKYQALFGIIQGAMHPELRRESAQAIVDLDFDGIAFGGESIGYNKQATQQVIDWVRDILPEDKPRYAMGLGRDPQDIIDAILAGYDMFDCVAPTRLARNGTLYNGAIQFPFLLSGENSSEPSHEKRGGNGRSSEKTNQLQPVFLSEFNNGRLQIGNARFKYDQGIIDEHCDCYTCKSGYSRSYLRHLFKADELAFHRLASIHNVRFMIRLSEEMREWILS